MSVRSRQAKPEPAKNAKADSDILSFTGDKDSSFVRVCLCGKPKTGKTYFMATSPSPFFIDTDKGLMTLVGMKVNAPAYRLERVSAGTNRESDTAFLQIRSILAQLKNGSGPVISALKKAKYEPKTLCIDSGSALSDLFEVDVINFPPDGKDRSDTLQLQDYNVIQRRMFQIIDMARELPMNLIVSFGLDILQDESNRMVNNPSATGNKLGPKIPHFFDEVYLTWYDREDGAYYLTPQQNRSFPHAGSRFQVPPEDFKNPKWKDFLKYYGGEKT